MIEVHLNLIPYLKYTTKHAETLRCHHGERSTYFYLLRHFPIAHEDILVELHDIFRTRIAESSCRRKSDLKLITTLQSAHHLHKTGNNLMRHTIYHKIGLTFFCLKQ